MINISSPVKVKEYLNKQYPGREIVAVNNYLTPEWYVENYINEMYQGTEPHEWVGSNDTESSDNIKFLVPSYTQGYGENSSHSGELAMSGLTEAIISGCCDNDMIYSNTGLVVELLLLLPKVVILNIVNATVGE